MKAFLDIIQSTRCWVFGIIELTHLLIRFTRKLEWSWTKSKELTYQILRSICITKAIMFGWDLIIPIDLYLDASNFASGCYIIWIQDGETKLLLYDLFILLLADLNHNTYRCKWAAIVKFIKKYFHMFNVKYRSIVYTN